MKIVSLTFLFLLIWVAMVKMVMETVPCKTNAGADNDRRSRNPNLLTLEAISDVIRLKND